MSINTILLSAMLLPITGFRYLWSLFESEFATTLWEDLGRYPSLLMDENFTSATFSEVLDCARLVKLFALVVANDKGDRLC